MEEHLARTTMDKDGSWGTDIEITPISHLLGVSIAIYDVQIGDYVTRGPYLVDPRQRINNIYGGGTLFSSILFLIIGGVTTTTTTIHQF